MTRINNSTSLRFLRMHNKKYSEEYIYKLCTLLYSNDKEHKLKRKCLDKLEYSCDSNSNMCLTGLKRNKTDDKERKNSSKGRNRFMKPPIRGIKNNNKDEIGISFPKNITSLLKHNNRSTNDTSRIHNKDLFNLIPEFKNKQPVLKEDNNFFSLDSSFEEDGITPKNKQKIQIEIFNKLKTKVKFHKQSKQTSNSNSLSNSLSQHNKISKKEKLVLPELNYKQYQEGINDISYNVSKVFQKAKILREASISIPKMNFINLFSYKRSKWNHYTLFPEQKNESVPKRYKEKRKEALPNFKELERQRRSKSTQHLRNENEYDDNKNKSEEELQKIENERIEKMREMRKQMKENEEDGNKKKVTLTTRETMKRIKNEIKYLNNLIKESEDEDFFYKVVDKGNKEKKLFKKKSSFITTNGVLGNKMNSNVTAASPGIKEELNILYKNPYIKKH